MGDFFQILWPSHNILTLTLYFFSFFLGQLCLAALHRFNDKNGLLFGDLETAFAQANRTGFAIPPSSTNATSDRDGC